MTANMDMQQDVSSDDANLKISVPVFFLRLGLPYNAYCLMNYCILTVLSLFGVGASAMIVFDAAN